MLTLKRLGAYLVTFFIILILVIWLVDWKWLDKYFVSRCNCMEGSSIDYVNEKIVFVSLERPQSLSEAQSIREFRRSVVKFLNTVALESKNCQVPTGVVLDFSFKNDSTELFNLQVALQHLIELKIPVYASYFFGDTKTRFTDLESDHAIDLYNNYLMGADDTLPGRARYHTFFYQEECLAGYENNMYFFSDKGDSVLVESLMDRVARDLSDSKTIRHAAKRKGSIVPYDSFDEMKKRTFAFIPDTLQDIGRFESPQGSKYFKIADKIIVVGDPLHDLVDIGQSKIPGPYLVTWALSDILDGFSRLKLPVESLSVIIGQTLFFAFFVVLIFALLFKYIKRMQTKPKLIAVLSFSAGLIFLSIYGALLLKYNTVIPVGHTTVAMAVASVLSWRFAYKFLVTGVVEGAQKYDVFISYSRGQSNWVIKNVYEPLAAFRKPNGDKLNIFFDKNSIGVGEAFTAKYMWAIVDSKCFIPVISEDYYLKNHCKNELDCAVKRWVEKLISIQAIAFSFKAVPEAYNSINFIDVSVQPDFIESIKAKLSE